MSASITNTVEAHYTVPNLTDGIYAGLVASGKDLEALSTTDLAPVDAFHIRGREATTELAGMVELHAGQRVLDVGSGIGGTARYLASRFGCHVTGVDLTRAYCTAAAELSARLGLAGQTRFQQASALALPFHDETFDVVWTEHVQMNVADKRAFYREAARVLKPGGKLVFHDIFAGPGPGVAFPVPWASGPDHSFLAPPAEVREILGAIGLTVDRWIDSSARSRAWFEAALERQRAHGRPPIGLHLVMGETARAKFTNVLRALADRSIVTVQAIATR